MRMRRSLVIVSVLVLALALAACGGGSGSSTGSTGAAAPAAGGTSLSISGKDIAFVETALSADAGKPLTVNFKNVGALEHSLIFDLPPAGDKAGDVGVPKDWANNLRGVGPGKSETLQLPALDPGTYKYYCHVPGHDLMVGTLTVK